MFSTSDILAGGTVSSGDLPVRSSLQFIMVSTSDILAGGTVSSGDLVVRTIFQFITCAPQVTYTCWSVSSVDWPVGNRLQVITCPVHVTNTCWWYCHLGQIGLSARGIGLSETDYRSSRGLYMRHILAGGIVISGD
ncbi:hypothetical protein BsWGS_13508 [Bradybaena similaris]